jgi:hypothetical protein
MAIRTRRQGLGTSTSLRSTDYTIYDNSAGTGSTIPPLTFFERSVRRYVYRRGLDINWHWESLFPLYDEPACSELVSGIVQHFRELHDSGQPLLEYEQRLDF